MAGMPMFKRRRMCSNACAWAAKSPTLEQYAEKFWKRVDKSEPSGCWTWQGYCQRFGHGWLGSRFGLAHRFAWKLLRGPLADDVCLLHHCDNPPCVNPDHLYIGDRKDNMRDKVARGRVQKGQDSALARLKDEDVREIRRLKAEKTAGEVGAMFGITASHIFHIWARRAWKHL